MTKEQHLLTIEYIARLLLSLQNGSEAPPLPEGITLENVYELSTSHMLSAATYMALTDVIKSSDEQGEYLGKWERESELAVVQHVRQTVAFAELTEAFTGAKIRFLPIKGFLFKELWTRPELRTMGDIDILVSPEDFKIAGDLLLSLGYILYRENERHYCYIKKGFVSVELHRFLYVEIAETFEDWKPKGDNPYWYEMSYEDFLLFVLRHSYTHYRNGGCGLRAIFDFYLLFEKHGRPDSNPLLVERLKTEGLYDFSLTVTSLLDRWFCGNGVEESSDAALYVAAGGVYGTHDNRLIYKLNKNGGKAKHLFSRIFPSYKVMCEKYKWIRKCPILLPIGYVVRLFAAIFNKNAHHEMQVIIETTTDKKI